MHGGEIIRQHLTGVPCEFCPKPTVARGMCENHYRRWKKWGDPFGGQIRVGVTVNDRFWSKVNMTEDCWLWTDAPNGAGYGTITIDDETRIMAHRYSWLLAGQSLTPGLQLDHLCRVRLCVRPDHLEEVTAAENLARARGANSGRVGSGSAVI